MRFKKQNRSQSAILFKVLVKAMAIALLVAVVCRAAWALGEEQFGNAPLNAANYKEWPGIMPVVNHSSRVYHVWVNGNEFFYYRGDVAALNDTLRKFGEAKSPGLEIVLRPAPGVAHSFDGKQTIAFGWNLHLLGGLATGLSALEQGGKIWPPHPVLSVYVGGDTDLSKLQFPQGVTLTPLSELKQRAREGLQSKDITVRGWGAGQLAELDPYDTQSRDVIAGLLQDKDNWVRLNAVSALPQFGRGAQSLLPQLRAMQTTTDMPLKQELPKSIQAIETAEDNAAAQKENQAVQQRIQRFLSRRKR